MSCTLPHLYHILVSTPKKLCNDSIFPTTILVNFQINYPQSPPFRADLPHSPVFSCLLRRFKLREYPTISTVKESYHCVKCVQIQSYFWFVFFFIQTEYGDLLRKSPYSVRIQEIRTRNNSVFGHFSRSVCD